MTVAEAPVFARRPLVYVAGPYSPDPVAGTRAAIQAADRLLAAGLAPVVPHLSMLWDLVSPHPPEVWYELDWQVLVRCDAVLRLPGVSTGSDDEVRLAGSLGVPVFHDEGDLVRALLPTVVLPVAPTPVACRGFQWLGQSMDHCERCDRPWHAHDGMERPVPGAGPFSDEVFIEPWSSPPRAPAAECPGCEWCGPVVPQRGDVPG